MGSACSACELGQNEINLDVQVEHPSKAKLLSRKEAKKVRGAKSSKEKKRSTSAAEAVASALASAPAPPEVAMPSLEAAAPCSPDASPAGDAPLSEEPLLDLGCVAPEEDHLLLESSFLAGTADAAITPRSEAPLLDHGCVAPEEDHLLDESSFLAGPADAATDEPPRAEAARLPAAPPRAWPHLPSVGTWLRPAPVPLKAPVPAAVPPALADASKVAEEERAAPAIPQLGAGDEAFVVGEAPKAPRPPTAERPFFLLPSVGSWLRPAPRPRAPPAAAKVAAPPASASTSLLDAPLLLDAVSYGAPMPAEWKEDPAAAAAWFAGQLAATTTTTLVGTPHVAFFADGDRHLLRTATSV